MQATQVKNETNLANSQVSDKEVAEKLEAVRELSALELSLVGGGTIAVAFY